MAEQVASTSILLIGAGGHCRSCIEVIESTGQYSIKGLVGTEAEQNRNVLGYPVVGTDNDLPHLIDKNMAALVTIGQIKSATPRKSAFERLSKLGILTPVIRASSSVCSRHAQIDGGTILMHQSVVNAGATVGHNCILNTHSLIEHDAKIGDDCHISTGAVINGGASVGDESFVGSRAVIFHGVNIGRGCVIGGGAVVRKDVPDGRTVVR